MPWVFVLFLLPLALFAVFVRRALRVSQLIRSPGGLWSLLSHESRSAIVAAGLDPDSLSLERIQQSEELQRLVAPDLQRALRSVALGRPLPAATALPGASDPHASHGPTRALRAASVGSSAQGGEPRLPPPIDRPSSAGLRIAALLVLIGLAALAALWMDSQP